MVKWSNPLSWKVDFHQDGHSQQLHCTASLKWPKQTLCREDKEEKRVKKEGGKKEGKKKRKRKKKTQKEMLHNAYIYIKVYMSVHVMEWCSLMWCVMCYPQSNLVCAWCLLPFGQLVCPRRAVCLLTVSCTEILSIHSKSVFKENCLCTEILILQSVFQGELFM